jgi:hypothetical protein
MAKTNGVESRARVEGRSGIALSIEGAELHSPVTVEAYRQIPQEREIDLQNGGGVRANVDDQVQRRQFMLEATKGLTEKAFNTVPGHGTSDTAADRKPDPGIIQPVRTGEDHQGTGGSLGAGGVDTGKLPRVRKSMPCAEGKPSPGHAGR